MNAAPCGLRGGPAAAVQPRRAERRARRGAQGYWQKGKWVCTGWYDEDGFWFEEAGLDEGVRSLCLPIIVYT